MTRLFPERRVDRNGRIVTRWVRAEGTLTAAGRIPAPSTVAEDDPRITCTQCNNTFLRGAGHRCTVNDLIHISNTAQSVLDACLNAGGTPVLVGGCVRDALMTCNAGGSFEPKDYDIEVHGAADSRHLWAALDSIGSVNESGIESGIFRSQVNGEDFDVLLPRRSYNDASLEYGAEDAEIFGRRDFTINSMGYDPRTQELIDPYGGTADLADGVLRHNNERFTEEPVHVLRGVQFAARFGFTLHPETAELCKGIADRFNEIPKGRVWNEFNKMFSRGTSVSAGLTALYESGWESNFPELAAIRGVPQDPVWHPEGSVEVHSALSGDAAINIALREGVEAEQRRLIVLAATVHDFGKAEFTDIAEDGSISSHDHAAGGVEPVRSFLKRINAPATLRDKVLPLVSEHMSYVSIDTPSKSAVRRLMRRLEGENGRGPSLQDWAYVLEADASGRAEGNKVSRGGEWLEVEKTLALAAAPALLLNGRNLIALGMKPGPHFGEILRHVREAQENNDFDNEATALEWLNSKLSDPDSNISVVVNKVDQ